MVKKLGIIIMYITGWTADPDLRTVHTTFYFQNHLLWKLAMETVLLTKNVTVPLTVQMDRQSHTNSRFYIKSWEILINWWFEKINPWFAQLWVTHTDMLSIIQNSSGYSWGSYYSIKFQFRIFVKLRHKNQRHYFH